MKSFLHAIFLIVVMFKLKGEIDWSWWWITAPIWGFLILFSLAVFIAFSFEFVLFLHWKYEELNDHSR